MAWIITLALFWAVGSIIASGIDGLKKSDYERAKENNDNYRKYFDNIYVLAWYYYQQFEPQVFKAWAEDTQNKINDSCHPGGVDFEQYSKDVFGIGIQKKSVMEAIRHAIQLKLPIYIRNQGRGKYEWGTRFVLATQLDSIDIDFEATELVQEVARIGKFYRLGDAYKWELAQSADKEILSAYIPPKDDPRTYEYYSPMWNNGEIRWHPWKRIGAPEPPKYNIPEQKREYRYETRQLDTTAETTQSNLLENATLTREDWRQCPLCQKQHKLLVVQKIETTTYKNTEIQYPATYLYCEDMNAIGTTDDEVIANCIAMEDAYLNLVVHHKPN